MKFIDVPGDFTEFAVEPDTFHFVVHNCNNRGIAGSGAILSVKDRFPKAIDEYERWYNGDPSLNSFPKCLDGENSLFEMGNIQVVNVEPGVYVVNMLGQKGFGGYGMPPGRYESIEECLRKLKVCCDLVNKKGKKVRIEACKFGSTRSGLDWTAILDIVQDVFEDTDGIWTTYSYEGAYA